MGWFGGVPYRSGRPGAIASVESLVVATGTRLFLLGASTTLGLAIVLFAEPRELGLSNLMDPEVRKRVIAMALAGALLSSAAGACFVLFSRRPNRLRELHQFSRLCSPLLLSVATPTLFDWQVYQNRDFLFAVVATLFGIAAERCFRISLAAARELGWFGKANPRARLSRYRSRDLLGWLRQRGALSMLALGVAGFAVYMVTHTVRQHYQLRTYSWDLGIFNNIMYNLLRGHWFKASPVLGAEGSHIQFHATFGAYLLAPIYALWQTPEMLIALQAVLVALGAVPLYLIARLRLGNAWSALVFPYAYLVHAPLHGPLFYDFHFLTITPVFVLTVIYCFEAGYKKALFVAWLAAISMREEVSATLAVAALYYLFVDKRPRTALWGGLLSAAYFLVVKFVVMPAHGQAGHSFYWLFQGLIAPGDTGFAGVLRTLVTNPVFTFASVFTQEKFEYLLRTLGPVLLLPVRHHLVWLLCLPAFIFTLLSTGYPPMVQTRFQYTANWTPYIMVGSILVLDAWRRGPGGQLRFAATLPALIVSTTLFSYNFGAVFQRNTFMGGFHKVTFSFSEAQKNSYENLKKLIAQIPSAASVSACELIVPHVSSRENAFTLNRVGASDADVLLCSTDWLRVAPVQGFMQSALDSGSYSFAGQAGEFAMWKKGGDHRRDAEGRRLVGGRTPKSKPVLQRSTEPAPRPAQPGDTKDSTNPPLTR